MAINPLVAYNKYFPSDAVEFESSTDKTIGTGQYKRKTFRRWKKKEIKISEREQWLSGRNENEQYELDVAMWCGTLLWSGGDVRGMLSRLFTLIYQGGLLYKNTHGWFAWANSEVPIASCISHGGRVMIQLPMSSARPSDNFNYWRWLWGDVAVQTRMAATHGVGQTSMPETLPRNRKKCIKEKKLSAIGGLVTSGHYGINIGVGGPGNVNPFSGERIAADGTHGHLYIYHKPPSTESYGALLIGCEGSAPRDLYEGSGFAQDQTGKKHTFGSSGKFSPTGGKKWKETSWHSKGPMAGNDAMFIDMVGMDWNRIVTRAGDFNLNWLGQSGVEPTVFQATMPSPNEWKRWSTGGGRRPGVLRTLDTKVLTYHRTGGLPRKKLVLREIIDLCDDYITSNKPSFSRAKACKMLKGRAEYALNAG